jgi:Transposase DDE domain
MKTKNILEARKVPEEIQHCHPLVSSDWEIVSSRIPVDIETLAKETKALQRKRQVKSPLDLLRLVLAYSICDWSLRLVGAWAAIVGLGYLSDVATRKRLRNAKAWLGRILGEWLLQRRTELPQRPVMMRLIDASTGSNPGSKGTDWRIHANFDLATSSIASVEVTDAKGGETLARHVLQADVIYLGDRGYAHRRGLGEALVALAYVILRANATNLPFETRDGTSFDLLSRLRSDSKSFARETNVWVSTPHGRFEVRLIAGALPEKKAEEARRRLRKSSRKKGHTPSEMSFVAAGFVLLVSNLPAQDWPATQVLAAYRLRWQVELLFKRLKGILDLDAVRAKDPELSQVYLMGKLVGALMLEDWDRRMIGYQPDWFEDVVRPVSQWRWMQLWTEALKQAIRGPVIIEQICAALPRLGRYLRDSPRKRQQQAAHARRWLNAIGIPVEVFSTLTQHESLLA